MLLNEKDILRSKERIKQTGEVFTPPALIHDMIGALSKIDRSVLADSSKTFLDPSCGDGNILVDILSAKLKHGSKPLQALQTIFGVDLMGDNVKKCRARLVDVATSSYKKRPNYVELRRQCQGIVQRNIIAHDGLTWDFENWRPKDAKPFQRYYFHVNPRLPLLSKDMKRSCLTFSTRYTADTRNLSSHNQVSKGSSSIRKTKLNRTQALPCGCKMNVLIGGGDSNVASLFFGPKDCDETPPAPFLPQTPEGGPSGGRPKIGRYLASRAQGFTLQVQLISTRRAPSYMTPAPAGILAAT